MAIRRFLALKTTMKISQKIYPSKLALNSSTCHLRIKVDKLFHLRQDDTRDKIHRVTGFYLIYLVSSI